MIPPPTTLISMKSLSSGGSGREEAGDAGDGMTRIG